MYIYIIYDDDNDDDDDDEMCRSIVDAAVVVKVLEDTHTDISISILVNEL